MRAPCCEREGLNRGQWMPEEDKILVDYIEKHGHGNWRALPKQAGEFVHVQFQREQVRVQFQKHKSFAYFFSVRGRIKILIIFSVMN